MPKAEIRGDKLTITLPSSVREQIALDDGEELEVSVENGRIILSLPAEEPLPGEMEALDEAKAELAQGKTYRLDDVILGLGRKAE
jgi:AbrB family looped-hinge helix DNA binding protein